MPVTLGSGEDNGGILRDAPGGVLLRVQDLPARVPLFLHDAVSPTPGTMPDGSETGLGAPTLEAAGARVTRTMDQVLSRGPEVTVTLTTGTSGLLKDNFMRRFATAPLAAQTIPAGPWSLDMAGNVVTSGGFTAQGWGVVIYSWRPLTGKRITMIKDSAHSGAFNQTKTADRYQQVYAGVASTIQDGDIVVIEIWNECSGAGSNVDTVIYYDGATERSPTDNAASMMPPVDLILGDTAPVATQDTGEQLPFGLWNGLRTIGGRALLREQDVANPPPTPIIVTVGIASETDTAKLGAWTRAMLGIETDTALPARAQKVVRVGIALETDTVPGAAAASHIVKPGIASETDTGLHATISQTIKPGIASETDTVPGAAKAQHVVRVGIALETDSALAKSVIQHVHTSGTVTELDTAPACRPQKVVRVGIAVEVDSALACTIVHGQPQIVVVGIALETDSAPSLYRGVGTRVGGEGVSSSLGGRTSSDPQAGEFDQPGLSVAEFDA